MSETISGRKKGISGSTLEMIAVVTMLIDHTAAGVLSRYLTMYGMQSVGDSNPYDTLYIGYMIMRMIGRLAFPIYCFLLVEGFVHTKSVPKYACRLLIFAILSEVPFDLLFNGTVLEFEYQNVFFTLWIGLMVMWAYRWIQEKLLMGKVLKLFLYALVLLAGMVLARVLRTDYDAVGVLAILVLYLLRYKKSFQIIGGCAMFLWEVTAPLAFLPIAFYNGKRGWKLKYFFYLFYPVHLALLYLLCMALGISGYEV
ncbi:MAG: conjugal transfer protein TraX [Lachnospiraceae bacterium]|nr:conjugal transfer protein TraX [Lachnospiraceae bacterium]